VTNSFIVIFTRTSEHVWTQSFGENLLVEALSFLEGN